MASLAGGGFAPIPQDWLDKHGTLVQDILEARTENNRVPVAAIPVLATLCDSLDLPRQPCFERMAPLLDNFDSIAEYVKSSGNPQASQRLDAADRMSEKARAEFARQAYAETVELAIKDDPNFVKSRRHWLIP